MDKSSWDQVERPRLSDEIRSRFEEMIESGEYAPGDLLPSERDLMERFGVGRPAIREALFALHNMGLVALTSGSRPRVTAPSAERLILQMSGAARFYLATEEGERTFQDARVFFEVGLARHAAQFANETDIAKLYEALKANGDTRDDLEQFRRTDIAFHMQLAVISKNSLFKAINEAMETWLTEQRMISLLMPGAARMAYEFHERIYTAVVSRDPDGAETAMRDHLASVAQCYWHVKNKGSVIS